MYPQNMVGKMRSRSRFDLTNTRIATYKQGYLYPCLVEEVLPGDQWRFAPESFFRALPLAVPAMTDLNVYIDYFFVPMRLIWSHWEQFITGGRDGNDTTVFPTLGLNGDSWAVGSLADHMGLPAGQGGGIATSALPFRAYIKIINDWYRDNNLTNEWAMSTGDGNDDTTVKTLIARCWEKDYFTTCLLNPQRGPAVSLPIGSTAPVSISGRAPVGAVSDAGNFRPGHVFGNTNNTAETVWKNASATPPIGYADAELTSHTTGDYTGETEYPVVADAEAAGSTLEGEADLSGATASTVNDVRLAFQIQRWAELNARAGVRLIEYILAHFGVRSSDARLQRSERLYSVRGKVVISEVLQTSESGTTPQGNMAGHGYSYNVDRGGSYTAEEHGYLIALVSILPKTIYSKGVPRHFSRRTRYDFYVPAFAHLGEQAVLNKELNYVDSTVPDNTVFGYAPRWQELRYRENSLAGLVRMGQNLESYTQARHFSSTPVLNSNFVTADPATRIFADTDPSHDCFIGQIKHHISVIRELPLMGDPGYVDHI